MDIFYQEQQKSADNIFTNLANRRWTFAVSFFLILGASFSVLNFIGFTPDLKLYYAEQDVEENAVRTANAEGRTPAVVLNELFDTKGEEAVFDPIPQRVIIESVGIDITVKNPESRDIAVLDQALLNGAVHYPGSGFMNEHSNMFIFGHSSYLPQVHNQNFRAFNELQKVKEGDLIRVESSDTVNIYRVETLRLVSADEALVKLNTREKKLTLSTCNTFGDPGDRYLVEAVFVGSERL